MPEGVTEEVPKEVKEEFPASLFCHRCRRPYPVQSLHSRCNTLLTDIQLSCPRCRRKLKRMRLKDWYDHYVHGEPPQPKAVA